MRELKIGDRVKITTEGWHNGKFGLGDIVYIVGAVCNSTDCPWYLSMDKEMCPRSEGINYFGPYRTSYEYVPNKNILGGTIL